MRRTCKAGPDDLIGIARKRKPKSIGSGALPTWVQDPGRKRDLPPKRCRQPAHRELNTRLATHHRHHTRQRQMAELQAQALQIEAGKENGSPRRPGLIESQRTIHLQEIDREIIFLRRYQIPLRGEEKDLRTTIDYPSISRKSSKLNLIEYEKNWYKHMYSTGERTQSRKSRSRGSIFNPGTIDGKTSSRNSCHCCRGLRNRR
jgi:hypothetical protein